MNSSEDLNNEMLTAYFDGELSAAEQREMEQMLFQRPELRRQLREWAVLRERLQESRQAATPPGDSGQRTKQVMDRIAQAAVEGRVAWRARGTEMAMGADGTQGTVTDREGILATEFDPPLGPRAAAMVAESADGTQMADGTRVDGRVQVDDGTWWADYRLLSPGQRMRRWAWQMASVATVAAALLLTVALSSFPAASWNQTADNAGMAVGSRATESVAPSTAEAAPTEAAGEMDPLLGGLVASAETPQGEADKTDVVNEQLPEFFVVYDVADQQQSWQQIQSLLASNQLKPVEVFEEGGSPALVLSGEVKTLSDLLASFQASGDHSLALMSRVHTAAPAFESVVAESFVAESFVADAVEVHLGGAASDAAVSEELGSQTLKVAQGAGDPNPAGQPANANAVGRRQGQPLALSPADQAVDAPLRSRSSAADPSGAAGTAGAVGRSGEEPRVQIGQGRRVGTRESRGVDGSNLDPDPGVLAAAPDVSAAGAGGVTPPPDSAAAVPGRNGPPIVADFNLYRQDIIRSQATVLGNSLAQRPDVTLETFINQHPPQPRARVPFVPRDGAAAAGNGDAADVVAADGRQTGTVAAQVNSSDSVAGAESAVDHGLPAAVAQQQAEGLARSRPSAGAAPASEIELGQRPPLSDPALARQNLQAPGGLPDGPGRIGRFAPDGPGRIGRFAPGGPGRIGRFAPGGPASPTSPTSPANSANAGVGRSESATVQVVVILRPKPITEAPAEEPPR
jgi:anti-sigma factor RsiW